MAASAEAAAVERRLEGRRPARALLAAGYVAVLLGPLLLLTRVAKAGAGGPLVAFADALGFAALALMALQVATSGRWARTTSAFGLRAVLGLHRQAGAAVVVLVVAHVALLVADDPRRLGLLDSITAPPRARAAMVACVALAVLAVTSVWRARLGLRYEAWRAVHLGATATALVAAFLHADLVDAYTSAPAVRGAVLLLVLGAAGALFWTRVAHPYASALRPYRVRAVRRERGDAVTVELEADGHPGLRFDPGQFARLRTPERVYGMDDHPFSLSSGAGEPARPAFTVKALGDWSSALAGLRAGAEVLVDGPHGEAAHDGPGVRGRLLVAAGIGITPALSVLRTAAARDDRRPTTLLYGSRTWADVTFREELVALERRLPALRVVHVLSRPEPGWAGERGRVDAALVRRHAPRDVAGWSALVCGPPAMVEATRAALLGLGLPAGAVQVEGFA